MRNTMLSLTAAFALSPLLAACDGGGGGGLVGEAEKHAEAACACADKACAMKEVAALNKISVTRDEEVSALGEEDKKKYDAAVDKASGCRDEKE